MSRNLFLIWACIFVWSASVLADHKVQSEWKYSCGEAQPPLHMDIDKSTIDAYVLPPDSIPVDPKKKKPEQPSYEPGIGLLTFWVGVIAMFCGYFSPLGILIAGGIFALIGVLLLLFFYKLKNVNPFRIRGKNILAKIIVALFFFIFLLALIGAIVMAFVVALALLIAAILSTVINPVVVAGVIMGIGVVWMLTAAVVYLIKYRKYKKSLTNG